uniref:Uncharacterized protein n=1 Tax=Cacopsylla melanoneura TaxID=428564 RepID=A0A8D8XEF9_9HEMI
MSFSHPSMQRCGALIRGNWHGIHNNRPQTAYKPTVISHKVTISLLFLNDDNYYAILLVLDNEYRVYLLIGIIVLGWSLFATILFRYSPQATAALGISMTA